MTGVRSPALLRLFVSNTELSLDLPDGLFYFILHRKMQKIRSPNLIQEEEEEEEEESPYMRPLSVFQ